jgi:hypothetical protein
MQQSIQARTDGVAFRRPTFNRNIARFGRRIMRGLERIGRVRAANTLRMYGYEEYAREILKGYWDNA